MVIGLAITSHSANGADAAELIGQPGEAGEQSQAAQQQNRMTLRQRMSRRPTG